jgi:hypothetical protein
VASNVKEAPCVSQQIRNVTSIMIVMIIRMKALTSVARPALLRRTVVDGRKQNRITLTGQDSMDVHQGVELAEMQLETPQVW